MLSGKIALGGPPILGFIAFLLTSFSKFARGVLFYPPPPAPPHRLLCASMGTIARFGCIQLGKVW